MNHSQSPRIRQQDPSDSGAGKAKGSLNQPISESECQQRNGFTLLPKQPQGTPVDLELIKELLDD